MGAVNFAVGVAGCTYTHTDGKAYRLTGWELGAVGEHEAYLEQRAIDALNRRRLQPDQRAAAHAALAQDIAVFKLGFGTKAFDDSLRGYAGCAHFFWQLVRTHHADLTQEDALRIVRENPLGVLEAIYAADPLNRATAEPPKADEAAA